MSLVLGQPVTFTKSLSRQKGNGVYKESYTDDQKEQLENNGYIEIIRFKEREHNQKQGFICGKRSITTTVMLEETDEHSQELIMTDSQGETVYVVACDMRGLYRVRKENLEVIK